MLISIAIGENTKEDSGIIMGHFGSVSAVF